MTHININEVFGPTVQGEGPATGKRASFVRFAGCNLACTWCDTPYSWDWTRFDHDEESHKRVPSDIAEEVMKHGTDLVIVTGGEPMLQQRGIIELRSCLGPTFAIHVETNGTILPSERTQDAVDLFVVSLKLSHAGDDETSRIKEHALAEYAELAWNGEAIFKFVAATVSDLDEITHITTTHRIPREAVWVMPEGATREQHVRHLEALVTPIIERGWNVATRLHVIAWDAKRGV